MKSKKEKMENIINGFLNTSPDKRITRFCDEKDLLEHLDILEWNNKINELYKKLIAKDFNEKQIIKLLLGIDKIDLLTLSFYYGLGGCNNNSENELFDILNIKDRQDRQLRLQIAIFSLQEQILIKNYDELLKVANEATQDKFNTNLDKIVNIGKKAIFSKDKTLAIRNVCDFVDAYKNDCLNEFDVTLDDVDLIITQVIDFLSN